MNVKLQMKFWRHVVCCTKTSELGKKLAAKLDSFQFKHIHCLLVRFCIHIILTPFPNCAATQKDPRKKLNVQLKKWGQANREKSATNH